MTQTMRGAEQLPPPSVNTSQGRRRATRSGDKVTARKQRKAEHRPSSSDTDVALLGMLYDTVNNPTGWEPFLHALTEGSFFNRAAVFLHDTSIQRGDMGAQINLDATDVDAYARRYAAINPWLARPRERPVGVVVTSESIIPHADLLRTEYYHDYCRRLDFDLAVGLTVLADGGRSMVVSAAGLRSDLDRDRHIVRRLQLFAPHLLRVAQLSRQLSGIDMIATATELALDGLTTGVIIIDRSGQIAYLNRAAERIVATNDGLMVANRRLVAISQDETQNLLRLVTGALRAAHDVAAVPGGAIRIRRRTGQAAYEALIAPLRNGTLAIDVAGPLAVVFVRDPEMATVAPSVRLQRFYNLTGAESRLLQSLIAGYGLDDIAGSFRVGKETLRSQLKSIFSKTGTNSQIQLLRLCLRGLSTFET